MFKNAQPLTLSTYHGVLDLLGYRGPGNTQWEKLRPNFEQRDVLKRISAYPLGHDYHTSDRMIIYSTSLNF